MIAQKNEVGLNETDEFEFNQETSIDFDDEYRSPGWDRYRKNKLINEKINKLKNLFKKEKSMAILFQRMMNLWRAYPFS